MRPWLRQAGALIGVVVIGIFLAVPPARAGVVYPAKADAVPSPEGIRVEDVTHTSQTPTLLHSHPHVLHRDNNLVFAGNLGCQRVSAFLAGLKGLIAAIVGSHRNAGPQRGLG